MHIELECVGLKEFKYLKVGDMFVAYGRVCMKIFPVKYTLFNGEIYDVNAVDGSGSDLLIKDDYKCLVLEKKESWF